MSPSKLIYLYAGWVRHRPAREALTALGIAVGVALVLATITANRSIATSTSQIIRSLAGSAQLEATARSHAGVPELSRAVRQLRGVRHAAGVLQSPVAISYRGRRVSTQLVGVGLEMASIDRTVASIPVHSPGLVFPEALATALGLPPDMVSTVTIFARGRAIRTTVQDTFGEETIGPLANSLVAFGFLPYVQKILALPRRVSAVLVSAGPGEEALARQSLARSLEPAMKVGRSVHAEALLLEALAPQDASTSFFALLGALVGVLLVGTATMLTMAERRRELASLRLQGFARHQLVQIVLFQGAVLGAAASLLGVVAGYALARGIFRGSPAYLSSAFPLGSQTVTSFPIAAGVWAAGVAITCLCVMPVLLDLRAQPAAYRHVRDEGRMVRRATLLRMLGAAIVLLGLSVVAVEDGAALLAAALLAVALLLGMPAWVAAVVRVASAPVRSRGLKWLVVAAGSVRATQIRSIALASTAAIGVFGAVVAQGAHGDLLRGLEGGYARYVASADVWVTAPGDDLATDPIPAANAQQKIAAIPGVKSVRPYYGGWVDMDGRRVWLIARSTPEGTVPPSQIVTGSPAVAARRIESGGWAAVSDQFAEALNIKIGDRFSVPTPSGVERFRLAATTTNLGWSSGVMFLPAQAYTRYWGESTPTALEVNATPTARLLAAIRRTTGPGVAVQTARDRAEAADALPRQGLERLNQIALMLVIAASIAVALAAAAAVWQRRGELASLRLQSSTSRQVQAVLAWEGVLVIGAGVALGAAAGVYGHVAADAYLRVSTGYPVVWALGVYVLLAVVGLVAAVTAAILAVPGYLAARAPLRLALDGG